MRPEALLGGHMAIDADAARDALRPLAKQLGKSIEETADSIIQLANANIVRAVQLVSTERGKDPRDYALVAFGGAGPLQAARVAEDLGTSAILVPPNAGVLSAYGLLAADYVQYETMTYRVPVDADAPAAIRQAFETLHERVAGRFAELGLTDDPGLDLVAEMRFVGQAFEVPVELPVDDLDGLTPERLHALFDDVQRRVFFQSGGDRPTEIVSFRLGVTAATADISGLDSPASEGTPEFLPRRLFENRAWHDARSCSRDQLPTGASVTGPLLIEDITSTILVPAGWTAEVDRFAMLVIRRT